MASRNIKGLVSISEKSEFSTSSNEIAFRVDRDLKGFVKYLLAVYGDSPKFIIEIAERAAKFARRLNIGNKRFKTALDIIEYGVPAVTLTSELFSKIVEFDRITREKPNVYGEREMRVRKLLGLKEHEDNVMIVGGQFEVGKDICNWIASRPKTKRFVIEGFYKYDDLESSQILWGAEKGDVFIVIDFDSSKFVWQISYYHYDNKLCINDSTIYFGTGSAVVPGRDLMSSFTVDGALDEVVGRLKNSVFQDFLEYFDVKNNVICLNKGLVSRKRSVFNERVNQYDIDSFVKEVRKVLKRGRKRGYAFVGIPGTGKSTIIRKLENAIRDYPLVYVGAENFTYPSSVSETFKTISYIQPCIVVMEDLDSYNFDNKNERLGVFLDSIDDVNRNLNAVFIATINDTKMVHYALINRPGRLDEVIMIEPPKIEMEVYEVMQVRFQKIIESDIAVKKTFPAFDEVDKDIFRAIIENRMTQADVCEVVEKAALLKDEVTNESLHAAVDSLLGSKKAIKLCDFGGNNPYNDDSTYEKESDPNIKLVFSDNE